MAKSTLLMLLIQRRHLELLNKDNIGGTMNKITTNILEQLVK